MCAVSILSTRARCRQDSGQTERLDQLVGPPAIAGAVDVGPHESGVSDPATGDKACRLGPVDLAVHGTHRNGHRSGKVFRLASSSGSPNRRGQSLALLPRPQDRQQNSAQILFSIMRKAHCQVRVDAPGRRRWARAGPAVAPLGTVGAGACIIPKKTQSPSLAREKAVGFDVQFAVVT